MATLLAPFVGSPLTPAQVEAVAVYINLLLRWNARLNLTAVRDAESIVTRHFGESLFAATRLLNPESPVPLRAIDVGSGSGFPGLPLKIFCPALRLTLIESQHKKATFLKEVIRALRLSDTDVFAGRAQDFPEPGSADLVTLRAVEHFGEILPVAVSLLRTETSPDVAAGRIEPVRERALVSDRQPDANVAPGSCPAGPAGSAVRTAPSGYVPRLGLLIGASQAAQARQLTPNFSWNQPVPIPESSARILLSGSPTT